MKLILDGLRLISTIDQISLSRRWTEQRRAFMGALLLAALWGWLLPAPAAAWMSGAHQRIAADALELLPSKLREALRPGLMQIKRGSVYPDLDLFDFEHHSYCLDSPCGDAPDYIAAEFERIRRDFTTPLWARALSALTLVFPAGCSSPTTAPEEETTLPFQLGVISHYLADVNVPYHSVPNDGPLAAHHLDFEREVDASLARLSVAYDGRADDISADLRSFAISRVRAANDELSLIDDPAIAHDSAQYLAAVDRCYSRAVNAVADLWYSLLLQVPLD